jgi:hypothetical protein
MRLQYQGYDIDNKFKYFDMLDGIYELENLHNVQYPQKFVWTSQRFSAAIENLSKINFRIYSPIQNNLILNGLRFELMPKTVININLENMQSSSRIFGVLDKLYDPMTGDSRQLGVMLYCVTVDGTDLY